MDGVLDLATFRAFATAILIGALVGIEREKSKVAEGGGQAASTSGLRTFILYAQAGAIGGWLARTLQMPWLLALVVLVVAVPVIVGYVVSTRLRPDDLGLTTETAAITVCLLGAVATLGYQDVAIGLGIVTAAVLAYKQPLHGLVARMGWDDVFAGLRLLIASFIVLPLLPDRPLDPWGALNPHTLWLLVVLIAGLSLVGYVATRWLGPGRGTAVAGLTGGLVSSTAVTLAFARRSRTGDGPAAALACGILIAWCIMFARVLVMVAVVSPALLANLVLPMLAMALPAAAAALLLYRQSQAGGAGAERVSGEVPLKNPFSLTEAARFAVLFAAILLAVALVRRYLPDIGVYAVAAVAGLTDVDAITLSMADYARTNGAAAATAGIVIGAVSNTVGKSVLAAALGGAGLRRAVLLAGAAISLAGLACLLLPGGA